MKLRKFYELVVEKGIHEDPRPRRKVEGDLAKAKKEYNSARGVDREAFDRERMKNPYADTRILYGTGNENVRNIMVGIDVDVAEIMLADRLREKGTRIDLVISHHPVGRAYAEFYKVMSIQPGMWEKYGIDKEIGDGIMKSRMEEVARGVSPRNHMRAVDAARLLDIPFMCIHTAADNCVSSFLQRLLDSKKPKKLKDVVAALNAIPEYKDGARCGAGPHILAGDADAKPGKIFVDMTGGTSGPDRVLPRLSQSGVKTLVAMHCRESAYKLMKDEYLNLVIAGHIASDTLGLNVMFDALEKKEKFKFIECSGFKRVRRHK